MTDIMNCKTKKLLNNRKEANIRDTILVMNSHSAIFIERLGNQSQKNTKRRVARCSTQEKGERNKRKMKPYHLAQSAQRHTNLIYASQQKRVAMLLWQEKNIIAIHYEGQSRIRYLLFIKLFLFIDDWSVIVKDGTCKIPTYQHLSRKREKNDLIFLGKRMTHIKPICIKYVFSLLTRCFKGITLPLLSLNEIVTSIKSNKEKQ